MKAEEICKSIADKISTKGARIILSGGAGTGKTMDACNIVACQDIKMVVVVTTEYKKERYSLIPRFSNKILLIAERFEDLPPLKDENFLLVVDLHDTEMEHYFALEPYWQSKKLMSCLLVNHSFRGAPKLLRKRCTCIVLKEAFKSGQIPQDKRDKVIVWPPRLY
jgi:hypothetical protein